MVSWALIPSSAQDSARAFSRRMPLRWPWMLNPSFPAYLTVRLRMMILEQAMDTPFTPFFAGKMMGRSVHGLLRTLSPVYILWASGSKRSIFCISHFSLFWLFGGNGIFQFHVGATLFRFMILRNGNRNIPDKKLGRLPKQSVECAEIFQKPRLGCP